MRIECLIDQSIGSLGSKQSSLPGGESDRLIRISAESCQNRLASAPRAPRDRGSQQAFLTLARARQPLEQRQILAASPALHSIHRLLAEPRIRIFEKSNETLQRLSIVHLEEVTNGSATLSHVAIVELGQRASNSHRTGHRRGCDEDSASPIKERDLRGRRPWVDHPRPNHPAIRYRWRAVGRIAATSARAIPSPPSAVR